MDDNQSPEHSAKINLTEIDAARLTISGISDLEKRMTASMRQAVAVEKDNDPIYYCITPDLYEELMEYLEDKALYHIVKQREGGPTYKVDIDEL